MCRTDPTGPAAWAPVAQGARASPRRAAFLRSEVRSHSTSRIARRCAWTASRWRPRTPRSGTWPSWRPPRPVRQQEGPGPRLGRAFAESGEAGPSGRAVDREPGLRAARSRGRAAATSPAGRPGSRRSTARPRLSGRPRHRRRAAGRGPGLLRPGRRAHRASVHDVRGGEPKAGQPHTSHRVRSGRRAEQTPHVTTRRRHTFEFGTIKTNAPLASQRGVTSSLSSSGGIRGLHVTRSPNPRGPNEIHLAASDVDGATDRGHEAA